MARHNGLQQLDRVAPVFSQRNNVGQGRLRSKQVFVTGLAIFGFQALNAAGDGITALGYSTLNLRGTPGRLLKTTETVKRNCQFPIGVLT
jgi:hypothetical protein